MGAWRSFARSLRAKPPPEWAGFFTMAEFAEFADAVQRDLARRDVVCTHLMDGLVTLYQGKRPPVRVGQVWLGDVARQYHRAERGHRDVVVRRYFDALPRASTSEPH